MDLDKLRIDLLNDLQSSHKSALLACLEDDRTGFFHGRYARSILNEDRDWTLEEFALVRQLARAELSRRNA